MAYRRVLSLSTLFGMALLLAPATAAAQQPGVTISGAPSFAGRNSSYTMTVTSTAAPLSTATFTLTASFPDATLSESGWSLTCGATSCSSARTITVFTGDIGGRNLTVRATGQAGSLTATSAANTWVRGGSSVVPPEATLPTLASRTFTLVLQTPPPLGVTFQLLLGGPAAAGSSVPTTVSIAPGSASASFTLTTGINPGGLTIAATTGSMFYTAPPPVTVQVLSPDAVPTPVGSNVTVSPPAPPGGVAVTSTFEQVTSAGLTRITTIASPVAPPSGYETPGAPLYFALSTTAQTAGSITVCASYAGAAASDPTELRLFRFVAPGPWADETETINTTQHHICGLVDGASTGAVQWAIFRLNSTPEVGAISGPERVVRAGDMLQFSATFSDDDAADAHAGTWVWGDGSTSDAVLTKSADAWTATGEHAFAAGGTYQARLVITDGGQHAASPDLQVLVDATAPAIEAVTATPDSIRPPNSRMHDVVLTVSATDDTGTPVCSITDVTANAQNAAQTAYALTGPLSLQLKAFPHVVYTMTVTCEDAVGRTTTNTVTVGVEKRR